jgi:hypothetical protein
VAGPWFRSQPCPLLDPIGTSPRPGYKRIPSRIRPVLGLPDYSLESRLVVAPRRSQSCFSPPSRCSEYRGSVCGVFEPSLGALDMSSTVLFTGEEGIRDTPNLPLLFSSTALPGTSCYEGYQPQGLAILSSSEPGEPQPVCTRYRHRMDGQY